MPLISVALLVNPNKALTTFLRVVFPEGKGVNLTPPPLPPSIFQEELTEYQYNFLQLLDNLFKIC